MSVIHAILLDHAMDKTSKSLTLFKFHQNLYLQFSIVYLQFIQHSQSIKSTLQFAFVSPLRL